MPADFIVKGLLAVSRVLVIINVDRILKPATRFYMFHIFSQRAVLGIEPRTSRTQSENHTTRPNSQMTANLKDAHDVKVYAHIRSYPQ